MTQKITITMDLDDDWADPDHPMGISEDGFEKLTELLNEMGTNVDVKPA